MTTREDIIRMAREAGMKASVGKTDKDGVYHPFINALGKDVPIEWLERFAALFEKEFKREASFDRAELWLGRVNKAVEEEREACARVCVEVAGDCLHPMQRNAALNCGHAIRARGQS